MSTEDPERLNVMDKSDDFVGWLRLSLSCSVTGATVVGTHGLI